MSVETSRSDKRFCDDCKTERARVRSLLWAKENRERHNQNAKKVRRANRERRMLMSARQRAKDKGLPFDIEISDIKIPEVCPVFGVPMVVGTPYAPSLDRIDPSLGYTKQNIQVISRKANLMKQDATSEELQSFAEWVKTFLVSSPISTTY